MATAYPTLLATKDDFMRVDRKVFKVPFRSTLDGTKKRLVLAR